MTGPELTFLENCNRERGDYHLSAVLANGRPVLTTDLAVTVALVRAVLEAA